MFNGALEALLLQYSHGYWNFLEGKPNKDEKYVAGLYNSTVWRILTEQLNLKPEYINMLKSRSAINLGSDIGYNKLTYYNAHNLAIYLGGNLRLSPFRNMSNEITDYEWFSLGKLPTNNIGGLSYPIDRLMIKLGSRLRRKRRL